MDELASRPQAGLYFRYAGAGLRDGTRIAGKIELASKGGDLDVLMDNVVDELNERAETRIALLPKALNLPLMIICVAMIGSIALAISLPFPNLIATAAEGMSAKR